MFNIPLCQLTADLRHVELYPSAISYITISLHILEYPSFFALNNRTRIGLKVYPFTSVYEDAD